MINSNDSKTRSESIKIPKEETLGSRISMNHNKRRRIRFTVKSNRVYKPRLIARWTEPSYFGPRRSRAYINTLLNIPSPTKQWKTAKLIPVRKSTFNNYHPKKIRVFRPKFGAKLILIKCNITIWNLTKHNFRNLNPKIHIPMKAYKTSIYSKLQIRKCLWNW